MPGSSTALTNNSSSASKKRKECDSKDERKGPSKSYKAADVLPKNLVRTDPRSQKLDRFLSSTPNPDISSLQNFTATPSRISLGDSLISQPTIPTQMETDCNVSATNINENVDNKSEAEPAK